MGAAPADYGSDVLPRRLRPSMTVVRRRAEQRDCKNRAAQAFRKRKGKAIFVISRGCLSK
jgi:hypothetical protein